jgi:hypothetical protein
VADFWPDDRDYANAAALAISMLAARDIEARVVGSYATGTYVPPYSDIDVLAVSPEGEGAPVRDVVCEVAHAVPGTICVTVDPFDRQAILYSILDRGLQIDWFVVELDAVGREHPVWRGAHAGPDDVSCRAWSSLLYTLGLLMKGGVRARALAAHDLAEHWVWLASRGVEVTALPACVPALDSNLLALIEATADSVPPHDRLRDLLRGRLADARARIWPTPAGRP